VPFILRLTLEQAIHSRWRLRMLASTNSHAEHLLLALIDVTDPCR